MLIGQGVIEVAEEQRLPFDVRIPNAESKAAIAELEADNSPSFGSAEALFDDLAKSEG